MGFASDVKTYQTFFNIFGYSAQALNGDLLDEDGNYGPVSKKVAGKFQEIKGIVKDGIIGNQTRKEMVKDIQRFMNDKGISKAAIGSNLSVDGVPGQVTDEVILYIQKENGLLQDKLLGSVTLKALAGMTAPASTVGGWTRVYYTKSSQSTGYTCGPASLRMGFSIYGLNISELWLKEKAGSDSRNGTSIEGILNAVKAVNNAYNQNFKARNETFKSWETFKNYLNNKNIVILRTKSWKTSGEHYTVLIGIHQTSAGSYDFVELGDPSNGGYRYTTTTDLLNKIKGVSVASVIVISK